METDTPVRETERILTDEEAAERAARKEAAREARRKKKQRKKRIKTALLIVLAVILVIVAAFAGFLLYLQKCGTEYDNITECVQSQPMDFTQRYAFSSADKTMSVRLDKNDLWWLLYQTGAIEKLEKMDTALAGKNIRLSGMGISTDNNALTANVELTCFGSVRIPLSANCGVSVDDTDITISVNSIKLGNGWGLPMNFVCNRFDVEPSALNVKISRSIHPFLNDLTQLTVADGCVVITMNATDKLFAEALANADQVKELSKFGIESPAIAAVVEAASGTGDTAFRTALDSFADANAYADFRTSALALGTVDADSAYMSNQDYAPYIQRFLPSLTLEGVTSLNSELYSLSANREQLLETLATNVNTAYIKGTIGEPKPAEDTSKDSKDKKKTEAAATETAATPAGSFVSYTEGSPALTMESMSGNNWASYSEWITEGDFRVVYLNGFPNVSVQIEKAKEDDASEKDKKKKTEEEASASETVASPEKPIGLLVRLKDGSFRLFYHEAALKEGSKTDVQFTIAHIDLDSAAGEEYMALSFIPSVTYTAPAVTPATEAATAETPAEQDGAATTDQAAA
ncbi:MAG: hypothetical protein ACLTYI_06160 [Christensenellales bacterium]|jgi:hypothetical protein|nr:hypothetical protein [Clostridium sp.]